MRLPNTVIVFTSDHSVAGWGVFESGLFLKRTLSDRPLIGYKETSTSATKAAFYESVKISNYKESARLEGILSTLLKL